MSKFIANVAMLAVAWLIGAWSLMLSVGVIHAEWIPQLPTVGFPTALLLGALLMARTVIGEVLKAVAVEMNGTDR